MSTRNRDRSTGSALVREVYAGDDPVNASDPSGLISCHAGMCRYFPPCWLTETCPKSKPKPTPPPTTPTTPPTSKLPAPIPGQPWVVKHTPAIYTSPYTLTTQIQLQSTGNACPNQPPPIWMDIADYSGDTSGLGAGWATYTVTSGHETRGPWSTFDTVEIPVPDEDTLVGLLDTGLPPIGRTTSPVWEFTAEFGQLNYQLHINAELALSWNWLEYNVNYAYQL
jgi:hypothetical protein